MAGDRGGLHRSTLERWTGADNGLGFGHERDERYVQLEIRGTFEPSAVSALLGIQPDQTARAGDPVLPEASTRHHTDFWAISSGLDRSADVHAHLDELALRCQTASQHLSGLGRQHALVIDIVVYCHEAQGPLVLLTPNHTRLASKWNAAINLDIYCV